MRRKNNVLTKIDAVQNALDYVVRNLGSKTISAEQTVEALKQQLRTLETIQSLVESE